MIEKSAAERAHDVAEFIGEIIGAAEWYMSLHPGNAACLCYPRDQIALLKACREQLEASLDDRHERRSAAIKDGIAAIAAIRATARQADHLIAITVNRDVVHQLRGVMPFLVECEVLKEKDHLYSKRGRKR